MPLQAAAMACSRTPKCRLRPARSARREVAAAVDERVVRRRQVGGAADQLRQAAGDRVDRLAGRGPRGQAAVLRLEDRQVRVPAVRQPPRRSPLPLRRQVRLRRLPGVDTALPAGVAPRCPRRRLPRKNVEHVVGHEEARLERPAEVLLGRRAARPLPAARRAPCAVSCLCGAPKPMCVRTQIERRPRPSRPWRPRWPRRPRRRRCRPRPSARASRTRRSGRPRPP